MLVNCLMGMSRSSTCVLAFLMIKRDKSAVEALAQVRQHRDHALNQRVFHQVGGGHLVLGHNKPFYALPDGCQLIAENNPLVRCMTGTSDPTTGSSDRSPSSTSTSNNGEDKIKLN